MTRAETLDTAKQMVCGHREQDYGTPENNFQAIADLWNAYMKNVRGKPSFRLEQPTFTPFDVAIMMSLFKHGRIISGSATDDSLVDACGYLACGAEIKGDAKESLKEMVDLNQEATDKFKQLNENLQRIKSTFPEKEEPKTEKPNKLKDLIRKAYGDADGYIACFACPLSKANISDESECPNHGVCLGRGDAVDYIYDYLKDEGYMKILKTMLENDKETDTVNWDDRDPGSGAKLY